MTQQATPSSRMGLYLMLIVCAIYILFANFWGCARNRELAELKKGSSAYESNLNRLHEQLDSLRAILDSAYDGGGKAVAKSASGKSTTTGASSVLFGGDISDKGTHFEVQIGAFQFFDLHKYRPGFNKSFQEERDADDLDKYTIAKFRSYIEAQAFKHDIIRLGIDDAWIVAKIDGKRVDINTALRKN